MCLGHTRGSIEDRFGSPPHSWNGHYGMPLLSFSLKYPSAVSIAYERPSGALYRFYPVNGEWVCFSEDWLPAGAEF
jgi:hypothetical protein